MTKQNKKVRTTREAVGIFHTEETLQAAIDELQTRGFTRRHLSVLADTKTIEEKLGHIYKRVENMEDNVDAPRTMYVPLENIGEGEGFLFGVPLYLAGATATAMVFASGGTLLTAILAAVAAGSVGGAFGAILANMLGKHHADYISDQIVHGGLLLWVSLDDARHEKTALKILKRNSASHIHVHDISI